MLKKIAAELPILIADYTKNLKSESVRGGRLPMKINEFLKLKWTHSSDALICPPPFSPLIADPTFLFPHETDDGVWHLFAHSAWGVCEYISDDGLSWRYGGLRIPHAMRPFIRKISDGTCVLLYEKYEPFALPMQILPWKRPWNSRIEMRCSSDLRRWSGAQTLIRPERDWMRDNRYGNSVSNPCLLQCGDRWRLYFSASLVFVEDCGFCEPLYIACAQSHSVDGPYTIMNESIIDPATEGPKGVIGAGSMKVLSLDDGYIALQNKIYRDSSGKSRSAIFLLSSRDGLAWRQAAEEALIAPQSGWMASHVYACDCRFNSTDSTWYLYFNARDKWTISEGKERIGRVCAKV